MADGSVSRHWYRWWGAAVVVLAGSALLRVPGLGTDLWLDELWSLEAALAAEGWSDLVFRTKIDNNHHLNSLYLYFVAPQSNPAVYRLFAFVSGIGTVATAWLIGARQSRVAAGVTSLLFGTSYLMAFYASEARGYATVAWLTLGAWYCLERYAESRRLYWAAGFTLGSVLGVMAHQTFVLFFLGAYVWCDAHLQQQQSLRGVTSSMLRLFVVPTAFIAMFHVTALLGQEIGGGPPYRVVTVVAQALSAVSGGPLRGVGLWVIAALVATVFVTATWSAWRSRDDRWVLYVSSGLIIPAIVVIVQQPLTLSPRYFIVSVTLLLLAVSSWLARNLARGGAPRIAAAALVAAHVGGSIVHLNSDAASRGRYREALQRILELSTGEVITVASADRYAGHDFRTDLLMRHYSRALAAQERIRYVTSAAYPAAGADWMIVETLGEAPLPSVKDRKGNGFALSGVYPSGDLSGTTWYVYRRRSLAHD